MNFEEIKKLVSLMEESKLNELEVELPDGTKVGMKKNNAKLDNTTENVQYLTIPNPNTQIVETKKEEPQEEYKIVKSPMVGTFYSKSAPDAKPYVEVGSKVKKGDILCIVEAMKLMNEIESEFDGEIVEVCVKDGEMVDFGKPLFKLK